MCPKCEQHAEHVYFEGPSRYFDLLQRKRACVETGEMTLVSGSCALDAVQPGAPWPEDVIHHTFACGACGQQFLLSVDTFHGRGSWRPMHNE